MRVYVHLHVLYFYFLSALWILIVALWAIEPFLKSSTYILNVEALYFARIPISSTIMSLLVQKTSYWALCLSFVDFGGITGSYIYIAYEERPIWSWQRYMMYTTWPDPGGLLETAQTHILTAIIQGVSSSYHTKCFNKAWGALKGIGILFHLEQLWTKTMSGRTKIINRVA